MSIQKFVFALFFLMSAIDLNATAAKALDSGDSVDLQWSICGISPNEALRRMQGSAPAPDRLDQVTYYDSNRALLARQGISLRTKFKKGDLASSVKVRFSQPTSQADADCSWDRYGSQETYTCELIETGQSQKHPWSQEQVTFVEQHSSVDFRSLMAFGPYPNPRWKLNINGAQATFDTVEVGSLELMELSVKVDHANDQAAYQYISAFLNQRGIPLCPIQEGKTLRLFRAMRMIQ